MADHPPAADQTPAPTERRLPKGTVLIAGGGPVGLILAYVLAFYNVPSLLCERNASTTQWPKMDITNARSMELFRRLGLAEALRAQPGAVPPHFDMDVLISAGMQGPDVLSKWDLPGVDRMRKGLREGNDGRMPAEAYQRLSQVVFERWLRGVCEGTEGVEVRFGVRVDGVEEVGGEVRTTVTEVESGAVTRFVSDYVVGCDGAGSRVRRELGIAVDGGPIPVKTLLVHFKSRDLEHLHKYGRFWHIFFVGEGALFKGAIISQDEAETFTVHMFVPLDFDQEKIDSREIVYQVLGGALGPYPIEIDEILVRSVWRPNICITRTWHSPGYRIFLAGDAVHQNIPTGGYGMNMGIGDAFDLGWKLAAVINEHGGKGLLESYEAERKPVAVRNVERSGVHFQVHQQVTELFAGTDPRHVHDNTEEAQAIRTKINDHYQLHDNENKDFGVEMDNRYRSSIIVPDTAAEEEPPWTPTQYTPSTWPGARAPHIFLRDGSPIFDRCGRWWTLFVFSGQDCGQKALVEVARSMNVPIDTVDLSGEDLARKLYEKKLVLIRPDHHVAWRADQVSSVEEAERILKVVTGRSEASRAANQQGEHGEKPQRAFTATEGMSTQVGQFEVEGMAPFQR